VNHPHPLLIPLPVRRKRMGDFVVVLPQWIVNIEHCLCVRKLTYRKGKWEWE
jgi:hypothetical protein